MGVDILKFIVLFLMTIFIFSCFGSLMFSDIPEFANVYESMLTLFCATLGTFDFAIFSDKSTPELVGQIYEVVYLLAGYFIFLNLSSAILF